MNNSLTKGILYLVATPIGNLEDITFRALRVLKEADVIACEDTRQTIKLLNHYGVKNKLISLHEYSDKKRIYEIIEMLQSGKNVALCSDAGTPLISDPGYPLVTACFENSLKVSSIPGACAAIAALACSGISSEYFTFFGFFPKDNREQRHVLLHIADNAFTSIIYETPHRLLRTLNILKDALGKNRICTVCRELTKLYEEISKDNLENLCAFFENKTVRGEIVIIISGEQKEEEEITDEMLKDKIAEFIKTGKTNKEAAEKTALLYNVNKNRTKQLSFNFEDKDC